MLFKKTIPQSVSTRTQTNKDLWPAERQGYSDVRRVAYAPVSKPHCRAAPPLPIEIQERMSTLIVVAGIIAAAHAI